MSGAVESGSGQVPAGRPGPTGFVYDAISLKHTVAGHAECAARQQAVFAGLDRAGLLGAMQMVPSRQAATEELTCVHPQFHVERVRQVCRTGGGYLDPDTYATPHSFEASTVAVGGLIDLTRAVVEGTLRNGFAAIRPPGHHATRNRAMGFCLFNNVAVAAGAVRRSGRVERIAIVDFDVHHGNGTEEIFLEDPDVLYISTHQFPYYPGTGALEESGRGDGAGTTVNVPLPAGVGDKGYRSVTDEVIVPVLRRFRPELILVSAGYDAHWADPLAGLCLSLGGFARLSRTLVETAEDLCDGRIVFALEGGYDLEVLAAAGANSVKALLGRDDFEDQLGPSSGGEPDLDDHLARVVRLHGL